MPVRVRSFDNDNHSPTPSNDQRFEPQTPHARNGRLDVAAMRAEKFG
jgi:hypothetical protein